MKKIEGLRAGPVPAPWTMLGRMIYALMYPSSCAFMILQVKVRSTMGRQFQKTNVRQVGRSVNTLWHLFSKGTDVLFAIL